MRIAFIFNRYKTDSIDEAEFDSDETIEAVINALESDNHTIIPIDMTKNGSWINQLQASTPDFIFNTAEGFAGTGRESLAPIIFEQLKIPYSGSNPRTCFLTMDKYLCKKIISETGCKTPNAFFINNIEDIPTIANKVKYPVFVKPNFEGSSKGVSQKSYCQDSGEFLDYANTLLMEFKEGILVEDYIEGKDIAVPYIANLGDNGVLKAYEYIYTEQNHQNIYDYDMKIYSNNIQVQCPAILTNEQENTATTYMKLIVSSLGILDFARADLRVTPDGDIYFIEINALPCLQPDAGIFKSAKHLNLNYNQTIQAILHTSLKRQNIEWSFSKLIRQYLFDNITP